MRKDVPKVLRQWLFPEEAEKVMEELDKIDQSLKAGKKVQIYVEEEQHG